MRRLLPPALLAASLAGFVLSGLYSGQAQRQASTRSARPTYDEPPPDYSPPPQYPAGSAGCQKTREGCTIGRRVVTYYVDATIGGKASNGKCITEGDNSRMKTVPCP